MPKKFVLFLAFSAISHAAEKHDLVIYGGTSAAMTAAVKAKKMGLSVMVVSPDKHLGGLSSSGLGWTDSGKKEVIGGLSRQFYHDIFLHYAKDESWTWQKRESYGNQGQGNAAIDGQDRTMWIFEPHVAEAVFEKWMAENDIDVHREKFLNRESGVEKKGNTLISITTLDGETYPGTYFIDCTYEGDLMAAAGVTFTVGREPNTTYNETMNGVQAARARSHQFKFPVSAYKIPGDPKSGLVAGISAEKPGPDGSADKKVQAYCYRTCLTKFEPNRIPFPKPESYDPAQYELCLRDLQAGWKDVFRKFDPIPNRKTDTNNHGAFSFDFIGGSHDYPEASYAAREKIAADHRSYQQGLLYFLANDERVPEKIRKEMATWGLAKDEFQDNAYWPYQLYIREARRMVSDFVQTENHLTRRLPSDEPIGMGSYNMDSHNVQRYVDVKGNARNEGDVQVNPGGPYPIDYRAILPREKEAANLLVPVCLSSSHIAYGSVRMEPVFMILGESAATAIALAKAEKTTLHDLPYKKLKTRLEADGQILETPKK